MQFAKDVRLVSITLCVLLGSCTDQSTSSTSDDSSDEETTTNSTAESTSDEETSSSTHHPTSTGHSDETTSASTSHHVTATGDAAASEPHPTSTGTGVTTVDAGSVEAGAGLHWYQTCGDPVCRADPPDSGVAACAEQATEGAACSSAGVQCDAHLGCGAMLICAAQDPRQNPGGCPISRARFKRNIEYVTDAQREALARQVFELPLATYTYREDPEQKPQLGFILEDVEPSLAVDSKRDQVNLYAYTSFVVAALQEQQKEIERLREQLRALDSHRSSTSPQLECGGNAVPQ